MIEASKHDVADIRPLVEEQSRQKRDLALIIYHRSLVLQGSASGRRPIRIGRRFVTWDTNRVTNCFGGLAPRRAEACVCWRSSS